MIQFVQNYDDLSNDKGYQFRFYCDRCHNGFMSSFQPSVLGIMGSIVRTLGWIFGGWLYRASYGADEMNRMVGGKAHDKALSTAVEEGKHLFKQCSRCGKWVCPEVCWNERSSQCKECAPIYAEEIASAHARAKAVAAEEQLMDQARHQNYAEGINMGAGAVIRSPEVPQPDLGARCPHCGVIAGKAKFCPECGKPIQGPAHCPKCSVELKPSAKFCPECGTKVAGV